MVTKMLARFIVVLCCSVAVTAWGIPVSSIFVFGDSLSDDGNAALLTGNAFPPSPPYAQRFSNGPVAVEHLAARLGVALTPSVLGGTDYAVGGATTGTANFNGLTGPIPPVNGTGIASQVAQFLLAAPAFDPLTSLFVVWGGPNDFFLARASNQPPENAIAPALANLGGAITALALAGAQHILVPNMGNLGATPFAASFGLQIPLTALTQAFNSNLAIGLAGLELALGIDIIPFDIFAAMNTVLANPGAFGIANITDSCLTLQCANPDSFFFWDSVHPTARVHQILADGFLLAVPEPASIVLWLAGLIALAWARGGQRVWRRIEECA